MRTRTRSKAKEPSKSCSLRKRSRSAELRHFTEPTIELHGLGVGQSLLMISPRSRKRGLLSHAQVDIGVVLPARQLNDLRQVSGAAELACGGGGSGGRSLIPRWRRFLQLGKGKPVWGP